MNAVRKQIGELLIGDSELASLAPGGVHFLAVTDQDLEGPFVIFHLAAGSDQWAMGTGGIEHETWTVKGTGTDPSTAEDIDARVKELLNGADLGGANLFCRRMAPVSYAELNNGDMIFYRGGDYKVSSDAS